MAEIPSVSQLSTDWALAALQNIVRRYSIVISDRALNNKHAITRYELAAVLQTVLDSLDEREIAREDLLVLQRLQAELAAELTSLKFRVNLLEPRIAELENYQFSPTTTLSGEVILALSDDFGDGAEDNLALQQRAQLSLRTSFTGEDRLRITLRSGNVEQFSYVDNLTNEGRLGFDTDSDNDIELSRLSYQFPIGDRISVFIAPEGDDVDASNPFFSDRGTGSISRFGRQNPIYRLVESGGLGLEYEFSDRLTLGLGYYNQESEESQIGDGLFNGSYSASAKLEFQPTDELLLGLLYVRSYNDSNLATGTGSIRAQLDLDRPVVANSYGLEASWQLHPRFAIGGWVGFSDARIVDLGEADVWNYALTLAFPDLGKEGNLLGIVIGQEPKLTGTSGFLIDDRSSDPDTSLHVEAFYRHQIKDNLSITPGLIWITAPNHDRDNGDLVILTVRTTFEF